MASLAERVLQRVAGEFTPKEWESYLKLHPDADRSKHTIKKDKAKPPPIPDAAKKKGPPPVPEAAKKSKPIAPPVPESAHKKTVPPPAQTSKPAPKPAPKPDDHHDEHEDHEPDGAKPGRMEAWRDRMKGLSEKAASFVKTAPKAVKTFLGDPEFRKNALKEAGKHLTAKAIKDRVIQTVKEEVHEYKTAAKGVKKVLTGGKMNKHEKHAFRTVAMHLAIGTTAAAFAATGPLAGAAVFAKGVARQIALKSVKRSLENVHLMDELGHVGHGISHFLEHVAAEKSEVDPGDVMADLVLACVVKELENLNDDDLVQALNGMEGEEDAPQEKKEGAPMEKTSRRVLSRFIEAGYSGWDPPEGDEPDPSEEWDEVTKLFPKALQKLLGEPKPKSDHGFGVTVTMTKLVELGEESGVDLTVTSSISEDADEDGRRVLRSTDTEYVFWVGHKDWVGDNRSGSHLRQHLKEFAKLLKEQDPEAYKQAGF